MSTTDDASPTNANLPPLRWELESAREQVRERLQDAFVAGYLQDDELDQRLELAHAAEDRSALLRTLDGLPERYRKGLGAMGDLPAHDADTTRSDAGTALVRRPDHAEAPEQGAMVPYAKRPRYLVRIIGDAKRTMMLGEVPSLKTLSIIGDTRVRLQAEGLVPAGETHITFLSLIGDVRIDVPPGVRVLNESFSVIGDTENPATDDPSARHTVILRGLSLIGDIDVRVKGD